MFSMLSEVIHGVISILVRGIAVGPVIHWVCLWYKTH